MPFVSKRAAGKKGNQYAKGKGKKCMYVVVWFTYMQSSPCMLNPLPSGAGERRLAVLLDDHALPNAGHPTTIRT